MLYPKTRLFSAISFVLFASLIYLAFGQYTIEKQHGGVHKNINITEQFIQKSIQFIINNKKESYIKRSKVIFDNDDVLRALELKDRELFYKHTVPYFNKMQMVDKSFWGLHIILPDNMSFIRVHKPQAEDKLIVKGRKPLIDQVNSTKKIVTSFDDGKFGYFLRVVIPIFSKQNKYLGVAEFSINVDSMTQYINNIFGYEVQFLVTNKKHKKFLNELPKTEDGRVIFRSTNKELFKEYSINKKSKDIHDEFINYANRIYKTILINLSSSADIVVAFDITEIVKEQRDFKNKITMLVVLVLFMSLVVWNFTTKYFIKLRKEEKKNARQEVKLFEQAKMAQMGEMIGNIAHQWRQPLSTISTAASGMKMQKELGTLTDNNFIELVDGIVKSSKFLSETINTFRNFLKEKKENKEVIIQDRIDIALNIVSTTLNNNHIRLINNIDYKNSIYITLVIGELSQVIINIINNAKDILLEKEISEPWIAINLKTNKKNVLITIEDNAGGVPADVIDNIFNPYFTTKDDEHGTGLGLYMSKKIVKESLQGKLYVKNSEHGAKFYIELPINKNI